MFSFSKEHCKKEPKVNRRDCNSATTFHNKTGLKYGVAFAILILIGIFLISYHDSTSKSMTEPSAQNSQTSRTRSIAEKGTAARTQQAKAAVDESAQVTSSLGSSTAKQTQGQVAKPSSNVAADLPPQYPGGESIDKTEIEASIKAAEVIDTNSLEVIPPPGPGQAGLTQAEVDAMTNPPDKDPNSIQVIPPPGPGQAGLTQAEVDAMTNPLDKDPNSIQVIPPGGAGQASLLRPKLTNDR